MHDDRTQVGERASDQGRGVERAPLQEIETWRSFGFPNYEVSSLGRVRSADMRCGARNGGVAIRKGRELKQAVKASGYRQVSVTAGGRVLSFLVHRLVAIAFLGEPEAGQQVRHLNGDKSDNRASNLAWGSAKENALDRADHGNTMRGERHPMRKLGAGDVRQIRLSPIPNRELANIYGVTPNHIGAIRNRRVWRHL